jgi:hypothetical protein
MPVKDKLLIYADMLKSMGEGNGTQLVPDGEGGYIRTTNNFRNAENAGKRMTKQDWLDQAEADLKSGKAEPGHQRHLMMLVIQKSRRCLTKVNRLQFQKGGQLLSNKLLVYRLLIKQLYLKTYRKRLVRFVLLLYGSGQC